MNDSSGGQPSLGATGIFLLALLTVTLLSLTYLGPMYGWLAWQESSDAPEYLLRWPMRQFFYASMVLAALAGVLCFGPLRRLCERHSAYRVYVMALGLMMVVAGLIGILVVLPTWGQLSRAGGFTPDFVHLLTYSNLSGALWLFLLNGFLPYAVGYLASPRPRPIGATLLRLLVLGPPAYFFAYAIYVCWQYIAAP